MVWQNTARKIDLTVVLRVACFKKHAKCGTHMEASWHFGIFARAIRKKLAQRP
jgi:hypothetical protein